MLVTNGRPV